MNKKVEQVVINLEHFAILVDQVLPTGKGISISTVDVVDVKSERRSNNLH